MNAIALRIGVRYCGGCTPHYDRVAAVEYIRRNLPHGVELVGRDADPDILLVIAGCPTACVDRSDLEGRKVLELSDHTEVSNIIFGLRTQPGIPTSEVTHEKRKTEGR